MEALLENMVDSNQQYLTEALAEVRRDIERHLKKSDAGGIDDPPLRTADVLLPRESEQPSALETLSAIFGLSLFEQKLLLLCAGLELDSSFASLYAEANQNPTLAYPMFSLALAALPDPHWTALTPAFPLRYWRLIEVGPGASLTTAPLKIDERILHYLVGINQLDERLAGLLAPVLPAQELAPSQAVAAEQLARSWHPKEPMSAWSAVRLGGDSSADKREVAARACAQLGLNLYAISAHALPAGYADLEALARLLTRETALGSNALLFDCDDVEIVESTKQAALRFLIDHVSGPLIICGSIRPDWDRRQMISFDIAKPGWAEQKTIWAEALEKTGSDVNGATKKLANEFDLGAGEIAEICAEALAKNAAKLPEDRDKSGTEEGASRFSDNLLWDACRTRGRIGLDSYVQLIEPAVEWEDLILPHSQEQLLRMIAVQHRHRAQVYSDWKLHGKGTRGLGISALFAGASGTGKTLAAEVLAKDLDLDLCRIDLSSVVSKYIGETEKNLGRVFDAAERGGCLLLFDEADALFGKRSEVRDSHDRYANLEISYLLQRMETYRGLAILTTNMKNALDTAFLRRIRFAVQFPFPDSAQRAKIWEHFFPQGTADSLDFEKLGRLNVAGGNIRNIALSAAFLAADAGGPVCMEHIANAARTEYAKLEKHLTEAEIGGWI